MIVNNVFDALISLHLISVQGSFSTSFTNKLDPKTQKHHKKPKASRIRLHRPISLYERITNNDLHHV